MPKYSKIKFLSSDILKIIAIISMLIDHVAAGIFADMIRNDIGIFGMDYDSSYVFYRWCRHLGRIAFPIFCYLLVEGLLHTRNVKRYMAGLLIFGICSELPFDLAFWISGTPDTLDVRYALTENSEKVLGHCNVYFTLLIGLIVIWCMKYTEDKLFSKNNFSALGYTVDNPLYLILYVAPVIAGSFLAEYIHSDYRYWGIILIAIFFIFRRITPLAIIAGYIFFMNMPAEPWSLPAFILLLFYSGKRSSFSRKWKYVYYLFYPVHLLLIYLIRCIILQAFI